MTFAFGTKAETLGRIRPLIPNAEFCEQVVLTVGEWRSFREICINRITSQLPPEILVVRSSTRLEDGDAVSMAGAFLSVAGVMPSPSAIADAVEQVIRSYGGERENDQILVQPMVQDVVVSGVVMTKELDTGAPYYVINYDDFSGRTDTVTGGRESKLLLVRHRHGASLHSSRFRHLIEVVQNIERATGEVNLDIEFCIDAAQRIYVLQVRPLAARHRWASFDATRLESAFVSARETLQTALRPDPGIYGQVTAFSEMTDWNPAEMIGSTPNPLALGLYRHLITDRIWCEARFRMGYRQFAHRPLLTTVGGHPYIDVRLSLNSFLPDGLSADFAEDLINLQLDKLQASPHLHDKVEFEIALTCKSFNFADRAAALRADGLSAAGIAELSDRLGHLTRVLVEGGVSRIAGLLDGMQHLRPTRVEDNPRHRAATLLELCIPHGTLPFSMLARDAFIGVSILQSLIARNALDERDGDAFQRGVHTVATDFVIHMQAVVDGTMKAADFLELYGHLRPGTYDITSQRYDEAGDLHLGHAIRSLDEHPAFVLSAKARADIAKLLVEDGYRISPDELLEYIGTAIRAREKAKFLFTRNISDALSAMTQWGEANGLSRDDIALLTPAEALREGDLSHLRASIVGAREARDISHLVRLASVLFGVDDIDVVRVPLGHPTYVTKKSVQAPPLHLNSSAPVDVDNKIVLIESADPGYDWIFSHSIAGLITKFGGANSHMAIRCAEFGLPAAIGCGHRRFDELRESRLIELNCGARTMVGR